MLLEEIPELPPWLRYPLVALIERHLLVDEMRLVMKTQLGADAPDKGDVPGRPGWRYESVWGGWYVSNQEMNVSLDVKLDSDATTFDGLTPFALMSELDKEEPSNDLPETHARWHIADWVTGVGPAHHALDELVERGALVSVRGDRYRIAPALAEQLESVRSLLDDDDLAGGIFPPGDEEEQWEAWYDWMLEIASQTEHRALIFLHEELEDDEVERQVYEFLQRPPGEATLIALEVASKRDIDVPPAIVETLLRQTDPLEADEYGETIRAMARYALPREIARPLVIERLVEYGTGAGERTVDLAEGIDAEIAEILSRAGANTMSGGVPGLEEVATLLLEYAPERSLPVIRRALREDDAGVLLMAGRLAAIGQPWAIRELVDAIPEIDNVMIRESIVALLRVRGFHDEAGAAMSADPDGGQHGALEMLGDEMIRGMHDVMQTIATNPEVSANLDEWAAKVRAGLPADFDPS